MRALFEVAVLYVYAITDLPSIGERAGLQGAPLRAVGHGGLFAVVTEHDDLPPQPGEEDLWTHERVVEHLMEGSTALPLRFGSTISDETALNEILDQRREEFAGLIERLRGAVELGVRARLPIPERPPAGMAPSASGPGRAYLLELAERERGASETLARVHEPLAGLARLSRRMASGLGRGTFKAAYLVDRARIQDFRSTVNDLHSEIDGARISCTGPWPPYSFTAERTE